MKTFLFCFGLLFTTLTIAQHKTGDEVVVSERQNDDIYHSGESININAYVDGDAVLAGGNVTVRDTIRQDLIVAGGEIVVKGYVADDIRAAGGKLTIDSEIGDDVIIAGGEVHVTKNAVIHGNLTNFAGDVEMDGEVKGQMKSYSGKLHFNGKVGRDVHFYGEDLVINGEVNGKSKIVAENITIGDHAMFHNDVEYWSEAGEIDFKNSLMGYKALFNEDLRRDVEGFSSRAFGMAAFGFWIFYVFSALLCILLLNWAFGDFFSTAVGNIDKALLKSFGYGLIYLFGLPFIIAITFVIIIGIPIGLFLAGFYVFSLLFAHLVTALLIAHYLNNRTDGSWNFWTLVLLALGVAVILRLFTLIPFVGILISLIVIVAGYGLIGYTLLQKRNSLKAVGP